MADKMKEQPMSYWPDDEKNQSEPTDKRKGPDLLVKWVRVSSFVTWILILLTVVITDSAKPELHTILDIRYGKTSRTSWDGSLLINAFMLSIGTFIFTLISLLINSQRLKRKYDRISISLIIGMIVSGLFMIGFFVYYLNSLA